MKVYHVLGLLVLQGVAGDGLRKAGEQQHNRQLTGCIPDCKMQGKRDRGACFRHCNTEYPKGSVDWQANRQECKDVCREIFRTKFGVCKSHCKAGLFTEAEEELCSNCPCCTEGSPFKNALLDPDICTWWVDGGHYFYEEDRHMYRCDASAPKHYTVAAVATLSAHDNIWSSWKACSDNDNEEVLQDLCFHPTLCNDTYTETPGWDACNSLFSSIRGRKFPTGCQYDDRDIGEYCKLVLA